MTNLPLYRSHAIESLARNLAQSDHEAIFAYTYCDFRDPETQNVVNILGTLLSQLCIRLEQFPEELLSSYRSSAGRGQIPPTIEMISKMLEIVATKRRVYLCIDAIDEVGDSRSLAQSLVCLTQSTPTLNVMATSRNDVDIQWTFKYAQRISLEEHIQEIDNDIERFVEHRLTSDSNFDWLLPHLQKVIMGSLLSKSRGT